MCNETSQLCRTTSGVLLSTLVLLSGKLILFSRVVCVCLAREPFTLLKSSVILSSARAVAASGYINVLVCDETHCGGGAVFS